jgi:hypothetical protein
VYIQAAKTGSIEHCLGQDQAVSDDDQYVCGQFGEPLLCSDIPQGSGLINGQSGPFRQALDRACL